MLDRQLELLHQQRMVAIIRLDDLSCAVPLARGLLAGGVAIQEFTLTNPSALEAIAAVRAEVSEFSSPAAMVGVGSIRSVSQAKQAIAAGAQFVVTPTLQIDVIQVCVASGIPVMPGAMTPTEILTAWEHGASIVKVFPARSLGAGFIKDVLAPLPDIRLMPTGGINLENMPGYFAAGAFAVGVGGNLLDQSAIRSGNWERVTAIAHEYAQVARRTP